MKCKKLIAPEKPMIYGIPFIFIAGVIMHYLYDLTGQNIIIGMFVPVNESVWEHLKLAYLPIMLWWTFYYLFRHKKYNICPNKWFTAALTSVITTVFSVVFLFYFYTGAFGVEYVIADILILLVSIIIGEFTALHIYRHSNGFPYIITVCIFLFIIALFAVFTFIPPHFPIFQEL